MKLTERTIVKKNDPRFSQIMDLCHLSKNLYNATLYDQRQHFFATKTYHSFKDQHKQFVKDNNPDYRAMPTKISKQTMRKVHEAFSSFFALLEKKKEGKYTAAVNIPHYLDKAGYYGLYVDKESISKNSVGFSKGVYEFVISKTDLDLHFFTKHDKIQHVRFIPRGNHIVQEVVYLVNEAPPLPDNGRYASIDLGVNNLGAVYINDGQGFLLNGKPLKSINQYYNKTLAKKKKLLPKGVRTSAAIKRLTHKRNNMMNTYLHDMSSQLVNLLVSNHVNTLIIGYNKGWKQDINIGRVNNQKFVMIPFKKFVDLLSYKAKLVGINIILKEEGYTSKTSFLDREKPVKRKKYAGKRVKRGLFTAADGTTINADMNGAGQIMRKVVSDEIVYSKEIEGCRSPQVMNVPFRRRNTNCEVVPQRTR